MTLRSHQHNPSNETSLRDLRGWKVYAGGDDDAVGEVDDILVDADGGARYLSIDLDDADGRRVLLPVGQARTDADEEEIRVTGLSRARLHQAPTYSGDPASVDDRHERRLWTSYDESYDSEDRYAHPSYRDDHAWSDDEARNGDGDHRLGKVGRLDDYEVHDDDPDPRGWKVIGANGETLGVVAYLLGDTARMRVVYLVVEVDRELFDEDRHVLVPVGHATLDADEHRVHVSALDKTRLGSLEPYSEGVLDREYEARVCRVYDESYTGDRRYDHPRFRDDSVATARA